jgi:NADH-quinone oxidoreductase subunit M
MIAVLLIVIPLLSGLLAFFFKNEKAVRSWALFSGIVTLVVSALGLTVLNKAANLEFSGEWLGNLGSSFSVKLDGLGQLLCLLTALAFPIVFTATWNSSYKNANRFFAFMLLSQAGLMGVFLAMDALLFYFFWELALIPVYFLCSQWGGERRIQVTFKFFIYTFVGSLLMLIGIIYLYQLTPDHSFSIQSFYNLKINGQTQLWVFWFFFVAFAIKMPVFPFHTWQPDTYEQSPTAVTMILSGVMVKMGLLGLLRWLLPVLPSASYQWGDFVMSMAVIGIIYGSLLAMKQDDLKRLVAYSSIAHIGLMCAAVFAVSRIGMQGVLVQMFNHGINIIGLWIVIELIERQFGTRKISELGGLAQKAPAMAVLFITVALANIALPLTNGFVGEFLMFNGIFSTAGTKYTLVFTILAGLGIILGAVYTLNMIRKVFYGNTGTLTQSAYDISFGEKAILIVIVAAIFIIGIYPKPMIELTNTIVDAIINKSDVFSSLRKH